MRRGLTISDYVNRRVFRRRSGMSPAELGVALTEPAWEQHGRRASSDTSQCNTTGPPSVLPPGELRCAAVECYRRQTTMTDASDR